MISPGFASTIVRCAPMAIGLPPDHVTPVGVDSPARHSQVHNPPVDGSSRCGSESMTLGRSAGSWITGTAGDRRNHPELSRARTQAARAYAPMVAPSPQTISVDDRRMVAAWPAVCAEYETAAPRDTRVRAAIDQTRSFSLGDLEVVKTQRRRGGDAGAAARDAPTPAALTVVVPGRRCFHTSHTPTRTDVSWTACGPGAAPTPPPHPAHGRTRRLRPPCRNPNRAHDAILSLLAPRTPLRGPDAHPET